MILLFLCVGGNCYVSSIMLKALHKVKEGSLIKCWQVATSMEISCQAQRVHVFSLVDKLKAFDDIVNMLREFRYVSCHLFLPYFSGVGGGSYFLFNQLLLPLFLTYQPCHKLKLLLRAETERKRPNMYWFKKSLWILLSQQNLWKVFVFFLWCFFS